MKIPNNKKKMTILFCRFLNNAMKLENEKIPKKRLYSAIKQFNINNKTNINTKDFFFKYSENPIEVFENKIKGKYYSVYLDNFDVNIGLRNGYIEEVYEKALYCIKKQKHQEEIITLLDLIKIDNMSWEDIDTYLSIQKNN